MRPDGFEIASLAAAFLAGVSLFLLVECGNSRLATAVFFAALSVFGAGIGWVIAGCSGK